MDFREARLEDAGRLAELSAELGYPVPVEAMRRRLARLAGSSAAAFVGEVDGEIAGWIHAERVERLTSDAFAEVVGLVVAARFRRRGLGRGLVKRARDWAEGRGLSRLRVRTSTARQDAPEFYLALGFRATKRQVVLDLELPATGGRGGQGTEGLLA